MLQTRLVAKTMMSPRSPSTAFKKGSDRARELGRKGGLVRAAQRRQAKGVYERSILDMMDIAGLVGETWSRWRAFLKAVFGLPMTDDELAVYRCHTERGTAPEKQVDEAWSAALELRARLEQWLASGD